MSFARVRALVVIGVLAVAAIVFVVVALVRDTQGGDALADDGCPEGAPLADVSLPEDPKDVKVKILNGTSTADLADRVSTDFRNRGFSMQKAGASKTKFDRIAIIRYGPKAVGDAQLIKAYFLGRAKPEYNAKRKDDVVEIVIGSSYAQLATSTEVNQSLVELGEPQVPPGACAAPAGKAAGTGN